VELCRIVLHFGDFRLGILRVDGRLDQVAVLLGSVDQELDVTVDGNDFETEGRVELAEPVFFKPVHAGIRAGHVRKNLLGGLGRLLVVLGDVDGQHGVLKGAAVFFLTRLHPQKPESLKQHVENEDPAAIQKKPCEHQGKGMFPSSMK